MKENTILIITMILNLLIASLKLLGGIMLGFSSLVADSIQSFADFFTDIISMFASRVGKKRANKRYPFGYGMIESISNLVTGFLLLLVAIFIFVRSFQVHEVEIKPILFVILLSAIVLKLGLILVLNNYGKKYHSNTLLVSAKESFTDLISTLIVFFISIILLFQGKYPWLQYADMIGSIVISLIIIYIAFKILWENVTDLLGNNEENQEILGQITEVLEKHPIILDHQVKLMRIGSYYHLYLILELDDRVSLKQFFHLEKVLKKEIKGKHLKIRFIEIEVQEHD